MAKERTSLRFRYSLFTTIYILLRLAVLVGVGLLISIYSVGSYTLAWYTTIASAAALLTLFSLPLNVKVANKRLVISCLVESRVFRISDIESVRKISLRELKPALAIPFCSTLWGNVGQHYIFQQRSVARVYITEPRYLLEIKTHSGKLIYISCPERDKLIYQIEQASKR